MMFLIAAGKSKTALTREFHLLFSEGKGEIRVSLLYLQIFQMPLAQNNTYAKAAYFGVMYSITFQMSPPSKP